MTSPISLDQNLEFILQVRIHVDPKRISEFMSLYKSTYDLVIAEPECRFFVVGEDSQESGCFSWTEGWAKDPEWFMNVQFKKEYFQKYLAATESMVVKPREFSFLKPQSSMNHFKLPE